MFADLTGFTQWSASRDPTQVFTLLEVLYHSFDTIAKRRKVFKVETVGDCYVAVAGVPTAHKDHATAMACFANKCLIQSQQICNALEAVLGHGTADLGFRVGLHSGPVTAGVLRGDKGRFQLFGDTVNTTARIETSGERNKIHCSEETANLLRKAGHGNWLIPRNEKVHAKGKGLLKTYFIRVFVGSDVMTSTHRSDNDSTTMSEDLNDDSGWGNSEHNNDNTNRQQQQEMPTEITRVDALGNIIR